MRNRRKRPAQRTRAKHSRGLVEDTSDTNVVEAGTLQSLLLTNPVARKRLDGVTIRGVTGDAIAGYEILATTGETKFVARLAERFGGTPWRYPEVLDEAMHVLEAQALRARASESDIEIADARLADVVKDQPSRRRRT